MPFIPVYFKEEDLPLANLLASRLQLDTSPSLRNSITNLLAQAQVKAELTPIPTRVKAVALPQRPMLEEDPQPRLSRGPDKVRRKSPKHPKSIQEYILDHKGKTVTARDVVKEARKHQVHLNLHLSLIHI